MLFFILGGTLGLLTGMPLITILELLFWFLGFFTRIYFKFKGTETLDIKQHSRPNANKFVETMKTVEEMTEEINIPHAILEY